MKYRWLRQSTPTMSPLPTPEASRPRARASVRASSCANVTVPRSSTMATRSSYRAPAAATTPPMLGPQCRAAPIMCATRPGLVAWSTPVRASTRAECRVPASRSVARMRARLRVRKVLQLRQRLPVAVADRRVERDQPECVVRVVLALRQRRELPAAAVGDRPVAVDGVLPVLTVQRLSDLVADLLEQTDELASVVDAAVVVVDLAV